MCRPARRPAGAGTASLARAGKVAVVAAALLLGLLPAAALAADDGGRIDARWAETGGEAGPLGAPVADPVDVGEGRSRDFAGGVIVWSPTTDAWEVLPPLREAYASLGGPTGLLGFPVAAATPVPEAGDLVEQVFTGGRLYVAPGRDVVALSGAVLTRYLRIGGPTSYLGAPTGSTAPVEDGFASTFERGSIRWDADTGRTRVAGTWAPQVRRVQAADIPYTYRAGCPVGPAQLRWVRMPYYDWRGVPRHGDLVARSTAVADLTAVFRRAFAQRFPIRRMDPADVFDGLDVRAMRADNTSAFNCRKVTGNPYRLSQHSYGNAIDINTVENPYVTSSRVYPPAGRAFLDRSRVRKGMIVRGSPIQRAMAARGWLWGARWSRPDYQHFSSNGG